MLCESAIWTFILQSGIIALASMDKDVQTIEATLAVSKRSKLGRGQWREIGEGRDCTIARPSKRTIARCTCGWIDMSASDKVLERSKVSTDHCILCVAESV